ncbi:MAG: aminoglycoside phosphotransferase family protein [Verrucomicrobia bacterium]|nr:aminoglycoside phosphotransferase family protein [Verrucomicrobiota bacterium]
MNDPVLHISHAFQIYGTLLESRPHGGGHINDTYAAAFGQAGTRVRYIFQRINHRIFKNPPALMENIQRVTDETRRRLELAEIPDISRRSLRVIPATDGKAFHQDEEGGYWRCYPFIEGARTYDIIRDTRQAYEVARAFGEFQQLLAGMEGIRLHETIPDFHNTRARYERLRQVVEEDPHGRLSSVEAEWKFVCERQDMVDVLLDLNARGLIPERVTHNDTKLNNVMIDDTTETGVCVIDLDTVMPGLALYDFGDMVRTATSPAAEDETDLTKVRMQMPMFEALVRGYLTTAGEFLNETEKSHLVFSGKLIALEIGIRFLTDHLEGDVYFKIKRPAHNLDRCRTQLALVRSIEDQEKEMTDLVESMTK